jgi:TolB-like protein/DNA-binding winged helix-turn-helix (wHTH) protein
MENDQVYEFGGFRLDPVHRMLFRPDGEPVALMPKVFETLLCLVEHAGTAVSKTELMEAVWGDRLVEENSLNRHISIIRRTLGETPGDNRFVVTFPGRGYRFVASVSAVIREPVQPEDATDEEDKPSRAGDPKRLSKITTRGFVKVAAAYAIVAWLLLQIAGLVLPSFGAPDWVMPVLAAVLLGFPVAIVLALAFDLAPDRLKRTRIGLIVSPEPNKRTFDYVLLAGLVVAVGVTIWSRLDTSATAKTEGQPISIAVLPFTDVSPDRDQGWLADGMANELINKLYSLDGLRVSSPTSSFSFRNSGLDIRAIGRALEVDWIVEGDVRRVGDDLQITPLLISVDDGQVAWTESYDGVRTDVFSMQNEIATSVARVIGIRLDVADVNAFPGAGTRDVTAYEAFLRGTSSDTNFDERIALFRRAIELDPVYAAAWAALGVSLGGVRLLRTMPSELTAAVDEGYEMLKHAMELEPDSLQIEMTFGWMRYGRGEWIEAEQSVEKVLALNADTEILYVSTRAGHSVMLARAGRLKDAFARAEEGQSIQPALVTPLRVQGTIAVGRLDEARETLSAPEMLIVPRGQTLGTVIRLSIDIALNDDDPAALRAALARMPSASPSGRTLYAPILDALDSPKRAVEILEDVYRDKNVEWPSKLTDIALLAAYFGDPDLALRAKGEEVRMTTIRNISLWYPVMSEVRSLPGFKDLVTEIGLVDYWRAYGWPDYCSPLDDDDFECG